MNEIIVDFDAKKKRVTMKCGFHLNDAIRGYPSVRFNPRTKLWEMSLVKGNVAHFQKSRHLYQYRVTDAAETAILQHEALTAAPKLIPFPYHVYDFKRAQVPYDPMDHQRRMLDLSWGLKASAWFAKMGTGKTFAAIHLACCLYQAGLIDAVMVLAPATLRRTWRREFEAYGTNPVDFKIHETKASWIKDFYPNATDRKKMKVLAVSTEGLGVSSALYDSACGFLVNRRVFVICDESSFIKNPDTKRTERAIQLGNAAERALILNGSPIGKGIGDLYSQFEFLDPNIIGMGDYWSFKSRYLQMGGYNNKNIVGYKNVEELMNAIIPYTCEVQKDVLNLPPKVYKSIYCEMTAEQKKLLKQVAKLGGKSADGGPDIKVQNSLERTLRAQQIVGGWLPDSKCEFSIVDGETVENWTVKLVPLKQNPKMDGLLSFIEMHHEECKFIIWSQFVHEIEAIRDNLARVYGSKAVSTYYGADNDESRALTEARYGSDPGLRFVVANPSTAGLGLTFISGEQDVMYYYSSTNKYIHRIQSEDRSHRKGQQNSVAVIDSIMEKTIDATNEEARLAKMDIEAYIYKRISEGVKPEDMVITD